MAKLIRNMFVVFTEKMQFPIDLFSFGPGKQNVGVRISANPASTEDAWCLDWANIGSDFKQAYLKLNGELSIKQKVGV